MTGTEAGDNAAECDGGVHERGTDLGPAEAACDDAAAVAGNFCEAVVEGRKYGRQEVGVMPQGKQS